MKTFLFQGDSITDSSRNEDSNDSMNLGFGYPLLLAADLSKNYKGTFNFINKGDSGDRITDIYVRIKEDIINLNPDYLSILVGINDVSHELTMNCGVDTVKFEKIYTMLIEEILSALPDIKIIIMEPFVLKGCATEKLWEQFKSEVKDRGNAARRVADKFGLEFISLQEKFDNACIDSDTSYWSVDGVHPTAAGHQIIKEALKETVLKLI